MRPIPALCCLAALVAALVTALPAGPAAAQRQDRPGSIALDHTGAAPVRFRNADGGAFRPRRLVLVLGDRTLVARIPRDAEVRSEDRVDLSGTPLLGPLFPRRVAPGDAEAGVPIGPVRRDGGDLIVEAGPLAAEALEQVTGAPVVLTSRLPRLGTVSFALGRLDWAAGSAPGPADPAPIAGAFVVDGRLVLAAFGGRPGIEDWRDILGR